MRNAKTRYLKTGAALLLCALTGLMASTVAAESGEDILIIANKKVGVTALSIDEVRMMFLRRRKSWKTGEKTIPINAKAGSALREDFVGRVLEMTPVEEKAYWEKQKIRKGIEPPLEFSNMLKAIFRLQGSIGYVYRSQYKEGTSKVLLVVPSAP